MSQENRKRFFRRIEEKAKQLPWYVGEYIDKRKRKLSPASLLNYCHDFIIFFDWILAEQIFSGKRQDIPLETLEKLTRQQVEDFLAFLEYQLDNSPLTVNRKLSALKSLFHYLQNIAETPDLQPYLTRNVMAKVELNKIKEDQETLANRMEGKILRGDEYERFRQFIVRDYGVLYQDNKKIVNFHLKNRERDTAIVSLILGSGLRLSEVAGLDVDDVDFTKHTVRVIRKGNKEQYVYFSEQAAVDLQEYVQLRNGRYGINKSVTALFVAAPMGPKGTTRRLTARAIEKMVEKYAAAFGKPALSVHKLRHSFATRYQSENNDIPKLRRQLGHSSVQTTMIYTHLTNSELQQAINNLDRRRKK